MKKYTTIFSSLMAFMVLVAFTPITDGDGYYAISNTDSKVEWTATKVTGSSHSGTVNLKEGGLQVADGKVTGGKFTIDMTTIACTDLSGGMAKKLVGHLNSEDFFSVAKHTQANLAILKSDGNNLVANLTIKGITKEITFPATVKTADGVLTATAEITVDRTQFDVRYGSDSFFDNLGDKAIANDITFKVTLKGKG